MTDRELMQQALDALFMFVEYDYQGNPLGGAHFNGHRAIEALRARLAQPEPAECDGGQCGIGGYCKECPKPLVKLKEMLEMQGRDGTWNYDPYSQGMFNGMEFMVALAEGRDPVFREAPERWLHTPPQREWQGLTMEEMDALVQEQSGFPVEMVGHLLICAAEDKLKEKNGF